MKILKNPIYSLKEQIESFPQSAFAAIRKHDTHTGVDIYCNENDEVFSATKGIVESIDLFTGKNADSPWWNETWAIVIKSDEGFLLYGELQPHPDLKIGEPVEAGQLIGTIIPVLVKNKGSNPQSMLHFEMYSQAPFALIWPLNEEQPANLLNPTKLLSQFL